MQSIATNRHSDVNRLLLIHTIPINANTVKSIASRFHSSRTIANANRLSLPLPRRAAHITLFLSRSISFTHPAKWPVRTTCMRLACILYIRRCARTHTHVSVISRSVSISIHNTYAFKMAVYARFANVRPATSWYYYTVARRSDGISFSFLQHILFNSSITKNSTFAQQK